MHYCGMTQFHQGHLWFYLKRTLFLSVGTTINPLTYVNSQEEPQQIRRMNIQCIQPLIILAIFTASAITIAHCLPMMDVLTLKQTGRIKANILGQLSLTEPSLPDEALTEDEEKIVAAFQDYHTAKEARRAHVKRSMPSITTTFVGKLQKHGK